MNNLKSWETMKDIKNALLYALSTVICCTLLAAPPALALNKSQSAEYLRTLSRNATTEVDATFYNPAGLAFMKQDGFHFALSNYIIFQQKSIQDQSDMLVGLGYDEPYKSTVQAYIYPGIHAAYRFSDWAVYFNFLPTGGGGGGTYDNGLPLFDAMILSAASDLAGTTPSSYARDMFFEGSSFNLGTSVGAAYKLHDMVSVSIGYRLTYAIRSYSGHVKSLAVGIGDATLTGTELPDVLSDATIAVSSDGIGHTLILGVHIQPTEELSIGIHTELSGPLELENETTFTGNPNLESLFSTTSFADGAKSDPRESPFIMAGLDYKITPELLATTSVFLSLNSVSGATAYGDMVDSMFVSAGLEYDFNDFLTLGAGYAHGTPALINRTDLDFSLPHNYVSAGASMAIFEHWSLNTGIILDFGLTMANNTSSSPGGGKQVRTETLQSFSMGVTYTP
jgi:long-chain fatty acid transport protein